MAYLIVALVLTAAAACYLGWRWRAATQALHRSEAKCRSMERDRDIRQNLQHLLDGRIAENRRLKSRVHKLEEALQETEQRANALNMNLFHESGLRILAEKEDGARRMKMDLTERQLEEANRQLRAQAEAHSASEAALRATIADQQAEIERLQNAQARRAGRRRGGELPNQVAMSDLLGGEK